MDADKIKMTPDLLALHNQLATKPEPAVTLANPYCNKPAPCQAGTCRYPQPCDSRTMKHSGK